MHPVHPAHAPRAGEPEGHTKLEPRQVVTNPIQTPIVPFTTSRLPQGIGTSYIPGYISDSGPTYITPLTTLPVCDAFF